MVSSDKYDIESRIYVGQQQPMSGKVGGRNLLGLMVDAERKNSQCHDKNDSITQETAEQSNHGFIETSSGTILKFTSDENRNSIIEAQTIDFIPTNICEVTTTEITERKTKKKTSALQNFRNLVRTTVVTLETNSQADANTASCSNNGQGEEKVTSRKQRKNKGLAKYRKKKNRRSRVIPNEGAPLWQPMQTCCWKSTSGRIVKLVDTLVSKLYEAEQNALKNVSLEWLQGKCVDCQINIPKEQHNAAVRRRWKVLFGKKKQSSSSTEYQDSKPQNPVFSIDLYQVIENDKAVDKAHEIALAKINSSINRDDEDEFEQKRKEEEEDEIFASCQRRNSQRRLSDPLTDYRDIEVSDYTLSALRTIETLKEEDEDDILPNRRKSRLIEALTLSSTSASSVCILDKDLEFPSLKPQIPKVITQTVDFIMRNALTTVGIFRTGGSHKRVKQMKTNLDSGYTDVITDDSNPHDVAAVFKEFLRCLPDPLLTRDLYPAFLAAAKQKDDDIFDGIIINLVRLLPAANRDTLEITLACLNKVAEHSTDALDKDGNLISGNKMDARNLATLMAPNIMHRLKTYKTTQNTIDILNPDDNKAAIDVVLRMIELNDELFKIPSNVHDKILKKLLENDPELVDFVLRKEASRTTFDLKDMPSGEAPKKVSGGSLKRPNSAGPRTRYSIEEVSFHKSNSFNQPYKPFIRRRKDSSSSRPTSSRSDPPDRSSMRKSSPFITPPNSDKGQRKSFQQDVNEFSSKHPQSPRDSGVAFNTTPPTFQRNSLRSSRDFSKNSPLSSPPSTFTNVVLRKQSIDRIARDSAYESGVTEISRRSNANSMSLGYSNIDEQEPFETRHSNFSAEGNKIDFLNDVLSTPSILAPEVSMRHRKISLPAMPSCKPQAIALRKTLAGRNSTERATIDFEYNPEWNMNLRDSQFPDQETTL